MINLKSGYVSLFFVFVGFIEKMYFCGVKLNKEMIMETLTIELNNRKTFSIIKELEELALLRIVKKEPQTHNMADLLSNCISSEQAALMNIELKQMREEWERDF